MNYASYEDVKQIVTGMAKKIPHGVMLGNTTVGHIEWQMYLQRDYLKLDGTPLANASDDYNELLKFAQDNSLITSDTTDKSLFKYDSGTDVLTLPDYIGLCLQGGNTVEEKEAGLPNIKGIIRTKGTFSFEPNMSEGAFYSNGASGTLAQGSGAKQGTEMYYFDASRSSSIYSDSVTTVQPPAIQLIPQIKYRKSTVHEGIDLNKLMPLGTVINFMGTTAPEYYLSCDGTIYNILEYSALANFFEVQFGSKNYFGGDGTTTFAVPDLRGEFLRGTGTNSHTNQGSGSNVGVHQDSTEVPSGFQVSTNGNLYLPYSTTTAFTIKNSDNGDGVAGNKTSVFVHGGEEPTYVGSCGLFAVRPTNTSVLYCIKYK